MTRTPDAALIVDDNWLTATDLRQELKGTGIINVPVACSGLFILLAKARFAISFVCMPKRIEQDAKHPLNKSVSREFPSIPIVSYSSNLSKEWLPPKFRQLTGGRGLSQ
jgi:AmiR/NasT family two-component response regulator